MKVIDKQSPSLYLDPQDFYSFSYVFLVYHTVEGEGSEQAAGWEFVCWPGLTHHAKLLVLLFSPSTLLRGIANCRFIKKAYSQLKQQFNMVLILE